MRSFLVSIAFAFPVFGADSADVLGRSRVRQGVWASAGFINGRLALRDASTAIDTALTALPVLQLGAELWPEEGFGVHISVDLGTGIELDLPRGAGTLEYNLHQIHLGGRFRKHLGARADATALFAGVGLRGMRQSVQAQRPPLLVDRSIAGPEAELGVEWVLVTDRLWLRGDATLALPFFVRETPADSGEPSSFLGYGAGTAVVARVTDAWSFQFDARFYAQDIDFRGEGTRATRVVGATTADRLLTITAGARYAL